MMTAVAAAPLLLGVGMAVDYATLTRVKLELQQATDAAVLAIAREGANFPQSKSEDIARQMLSANLSYPYTDMLVVRNGGDIRVEATVDPNLYFNGMFGWTDTRVTTASLSNVTMQSYEIGLVLDTTGSMAAGTKLRDMKNAVKGLIDTMAAQVEDKIQLKFAMVPFAYFVNVGPQYGPTFNNKGIQNPGTGANWLDLKGEAKFPQSELSEGASRFQIYSNVGKTWPGCVETRYANGKDLDVSDATPAPANAETLFVPTFSIDEPDSGYENSYIRSNAQPNNNSVAQKTARWWKYGVKTDAQGLPLLGGIIQDLLYLLLPRPVVPIDTSNSGGRPKGPGRNCDTQPISPLTTNLDQLKTKVDQLQASGNTNITEGVAWGLKVLSPGEPFTQGSPKGKKSVRRIMIVLTDGSNTFGNNRTALGSSYSSYGYLVDGRLGIASGSSAATNTAMNARTLLACDLAKQEGLEIYTIRLEEPNVQTGTMLKDCASGADHYFDVPDSSLLDEAFQGIKDKVVIVRLAS